VRGGKEGLSAFVGARVYSRPLMNSQRLRVMGCCAMAVIAKHLSLRVHRFCQPAYRSHICRWLMQRILRWIAAQSANTALRQQREIEARAKKAESLVNEGLCSTAADLLQVNASNGHLPSQAHLAWMMLEGRKGVAKNRRRAFELASSGTLLGCSDCKGVLAYVRWFGLECEENEVRAQKFARESADDGSRYGRCTQGLIILHQNKSCVASRLLAEGVEYIRQAAAQGLDFAHQTLGILNIKGSHGVFENQVEGMRMLRLAAAQGYPPALHHVAVCHERGLGVPQSKRLAIEWLVRAQEAGDHTAYKELKRLGAK
jgi:TPR repeat protein